MTWLRGALLSALAFGLAQCGGGSRDFKEGSTAGKGGSGGASNGGSGGAKGGAGGRAGSASGGAGRGGAAGAEAGMSGETNEAGAAGHGANGGEAGGGGQGGEGGSGGDAGAAGAAGDAGAPAASGGAGGEGGGGSPEPVPFSCGDPLPAVTFPEVFTGTGSPPVPEGGTLTDGVYVQKQVVIYGTYSSVPGDVFELRDGFLHHRHTTYSSTGSALTGYEQIGTYAATGAAMAIDVDACGIGSGPGLWRFTASGDEIRLFSTQSTTTWVQTFELQR